MFYSLNNNVYLVDGTARSCIYDFNRSKLYSINNLLAKKIDLANQGKIRIGAIASNLENVFDRLIELGIIIKTTEPIFHQIDEIKMDKNVPDFAWIEITNKCNLKCVHCYNESDAHCDTVMSVENFKIVIDGLLNLGISASPTPTTAAEPFGSV